MFVVSDSKDTPSRLLARVWSVRMFQQWCLAAMATLTLCSGTCLWAYHWDELSNQPLLKVSSERAVLVLSVLAWLLGCVLCRVTVSDAPAVNTTVHQTVSTLQWSNVLMVYLLFALTLQRVRKVIVLLLMELLWNYGTTW
jgi:magnesium-transporting ATPase (P-type)